LIYSGGSFTSVDFPNATWTVTCGMNNYGVGVGGYIDALGTSHGHLLSSGGPFCTIDYPNTTYTFASGINDNGQIVGDYHDAAGNTHGSYGVKQ
jgi:hypothetical protein